MSMSIQDLRDYVRVSLDTDEVELPDTLLDPWCQEGQARVNFAIDSWSQLQDLWVVNTTIDVGAYSFTTVGGGDTINEILGVERNTDVFQPMPHMRAVERFVNNGSGLPYVYSVYNDTLYLWPAPADVITLNVRGLRKANIITTASGVPECPDEYHSLIGEYMLSRAYEQQDDEIMSQQKFQRFENTLAAFARKTTAAHRGGLRVLGRTRRRTTMLNRNYYDWESTGG